MEEALTRPGRRRVEPVSALRRGKRPRTTFCAPTSQAFVLSGTLQEREGQILTQRSRGTCPAAPGCKGTPYAEHDEPLGRCESLSNRRFALSGGPSLTAVSCR